MSAAGSGRAARLSPQVADFAPGLLAIQHAPPPRLPRAVAYVVCALFTVLLCWSLLARLDIVALADGRLVPESYTKIVQPAEPGIVHEVLVREGDAVTKGQVLIRLDPTLARADARSVDSELALRRLTLRRIDAELLGVTMKQVPGDDVQLFLQVQTQALASRQSYRDALAQEMAVLERSTRDMQAAQETLVKLRATSALAETAADAHRQLLADGFYSALAYNQKEKEAIEQRQDLKAQLATVQALEAAIAAQQKKLAALTSQYRNQLQGERTQVMGQLARLEQESRKFEFRSTLLELRAPQDGVVKDIATTTLGAVVQPAMVLLTLVPKGERLVADVQVRNDDVGFVQIGQAVRLKVAAYPFQKYGLLDGQLVKLAPDAQTSDTAREPLPQGYKAVVALHDQTLKGPSGDVLALEAGMRVTAEIHQGRRTVMEYLLSPVQKAAHGAGRER